MGLLKKIKFNPASDTLYILGDVIDRGEEPLKCLQYIMETKNICLIMGNHEQMMLDYYAKTDYNWLRNGCSGMKRQFNKLPKREQDIIFKYLRGRPYYKTIGVKGRRYFLSHAGLAAGIPFKYQTPEDLTWSREEFHDFSALKSHICIFGHTPTPNLNPDEFSCGVWFDTRYEDKICIDSGCIWGGALACLRLDDGKIFYVKSAQGRAAKYTIGEAHFPEKFFQKEIEQ